MRYLQIKTAITIFFAAAFIVGSYNVEAQLPQKEEITVIAPYEPTVPEVLKINIQPKIEIGESKLPALEINPEPVKMNILHNIEPIQEAAPPPDSIKTIYRNHIRAGFGNYITPYLELNSGTLRNQNYLLNLHFRHISSLGKIKNYGHSAFSDNMLQINGKKFFERFTLGSKIKYDREVVHHYGFLKAEFPDSVYNTSKDQLRQRFNQTGFAITTQSNNKNLQGFQYDGSLSFDFINDLYETKGNQIEFKSQLNSFFRLFRTNDRQNLGMNIGIGNYNTTDSVKTSKNTLIQLQPYMKFKYQEYEVKIGLGLAFDNDSSMHFSIYPLAEGRLQLVKDRVDVFVGIDGEKQANTFQNLVQQNPFLQSVLDYRNSSTKLRFYGGLQSSIGKHLDFTIAGYNTIIDNMPLFINDTIAPYNRFIVVYDDLNIVQGKASVSVSLSQQLRISTGFVISSYTTDNQIKAWHLPAFKTYFEGWYNYSEKLAFRGSVYSHGKSWTNVWNSNLNRQEETEIKPWVNLSIGATYRLNRQLHFFIDARNIITGRHFYWYNYPSQRLNVMAGAGFSF